jgi:fructose-specific phosphotransferase system IIC component
LALAVATWSPRPLRVIGRMAIGTYVAGLVATTLRLARDRAGSDAAAVPVVLATMHLSYGLGFLIGSARYGPPIAGIAGVLGLGHRGAPARRARPEAGGAR